MVLNPKKCLFLQKQIKQNIYIQGHPVVEITICCWLKLTKSLELPTKEITVNFWLKLTKSQELLFWKFLILTISSVTENPVLMDCFLAFYCSFGQIMLYFFKELFLFLLISFLYFVSLFIKKCIQCLALLAITCSKLTIDTNVFKVNNKDTRTTSLTLFCCLYC